MIFENIFFLPLLCIILISFAVGFIGVFVVAKILSKRNPQLPQKKGWKTIRTGALLCGISSAFFMSIVISTITPSVITIEKDLSHTEEFSFFSNGEFVGVGGTYIVNNSSKKLHLIGIGEDSDINVIVPSRSIKKVRKCPEVYFKSVPEHQHVRVTTSQGRRKVISGPSLYLTVY